MSTIVRRQGFEGETGDQGVSPFTACDQYFNEIGFGGGDLAIDAAVAHSGLNSFKVTTANAQSAYGKWKNLSQDILVFTGFLYMASRPSAGTVNQVCSMQWASETRRFVLVVDETGLIKARVEGNAGTTTTDGTVLASQRWYLVEFLNDDSVASGGFKSQWRIDGAPQTTPPDNADGGGGIINSLLLGTNNASAAVATGAMTYRWDDVAYSFTLADYPLGIQLADSITGQSVSSSMLR